MEGQSFINKRVARNRKGQKCWCQKQQTGGHENHNGSTFKMSTVRGG